MQPRMQPAGLAPAPALSVPFNLPPHAYPEPRLRRDSLGVAVLDPAEWSHVAGKFVHRTRGECMTLFRALQPLWNESPLTAPPLLRPRKAPPATLQLAADEEDPGTVSVHGALDGNHRGNGVYQFPLFNESQCAHFIHLARAVAEARRMRINHMGVHLRCCPKNFAWLQNFVSTGVAQSFPGFDLELKGAFVVRYEAGERHEVHSDDCDMTLNICLGMAGFEGGHLRVHHLTRAGEALVSIPHTIGSAILHYGRLNHSAEALVAGERLNLILFINTTAKEPFRFESLPKDVSRHVLSFLDAGTLAAVCALSKDMLELGSAPSIWRHCFRATLNIDSDNDLDQDILDEFDELSLKYSGRELYIARCKIMVSERLRKEFQSVEMAER